jgi:hypothetical protein
MKNEDRKKPPSDPYPTANKYTTDVDRQPGEHDSGIPSLPSQDDVQNADSEGSADGHGKQNNTRSSMGSQRQRRLHRAMIRSKNGRK